MHGDYIDILKQVVIFSDLDNNQVQAVADVCHEFKALSGERIITEGDKGEGLCILTEGSAEISKRLTLLSRSEADERDKKLLVLRADPSTGSFPIFGEMGLLTTDERSATVTAVSTCSLLEIHCADWLELCEKDYQLGYYVTRRLMAIVSDRLRNMNKDVLKLTTALCLALE